MAELNQNRDANRELTLNPISVYTIMGYQKQQSLICQKEALGYRMLSIKSPTRHH